MAEEQQDVETLKRRGRRRLVGAVALVLAAVIVLPMVFDPEPKSTLPPVSVKIPGENEAPAFAPKPPPVKPAAPQPEPTATQPAAPAAPAPAEKEQAKKEQAKKEPVNAGYVIQVGAFAKPDTVLAKLAAAKLPYYTEPASGNLVRVRAGPFASREAADKAVAKLKQLGFKPGAVSSKSG